MITSAPSSAPSPIGAARALASRLNAGSAIGALLLVLAWSVLPGCKTGPDHRPPGVEVPASFHGGGSEAATAVNSGEAGPPPVVLSHWWRVFDDPTLDALIGEAIEANLDVRVAQARVREARAQRGAVRSTLFPGVDATGSATRARLSGNSILGRPIEAAGGDLDQNLFEAALDMSWEIDVFGGRRRSVESAQAEWEAAVEGGREVLITMLAEVGWNYLEFRGARQQEIVARRNLAAQEQTTLLTRDRFQAGLASELDVARAEAQAASTRAQVPPLEEAGRRAIHRLSVLLGQPPGTWSVPGDAESGVPSGAPGVPIGLPSDLLLRRPDIRRAEREVAAASARIGVATAEYFPRFFLTGIAGLQSLEAEDFVDAGSRFWSLGPSVRWPIFNAGRIRQQVRVENARHEQAVLHYEQVVLTSLEEVENALVGFGREQERRRALGEAEAATRRASVLANERYRGGLVDFLDVLDAERSLLAVQDDLAQSDRRLGQQLVRLYKALGGGWETGSATLEPGTVPSPAATRVSQGPLISNSKL
ncbi:MAG: efflux transporter outer membrane subunit [Limisphaerales bacterium]